MKERRIEHKTTIKIVPMKNDSLNANRYSVIMSERHTTETTTENRTVRNLSHMGLHGNRFSVIMGTEHGKHAENTTENNESLKEVKSSNTSPQNNTPSNLSHMGLHGNRFSVIMGTEHEKSPQNKGNLIEAKSENTSSSENGKPTENISQNITRLKHRLEIVKSEIENGKFQLNNNTNNTSSNCEKNGVVLTPDLFGFHLNLAELGIVSPLIGNQRNCGSCWAFTAAAMLDSVEAMKTKRQKESTRYSPQQFLDCVNPGSCRGGNHIYAVQYGLRHKLYPTSEYPNYTGIRGKCENLENEYDASTLPNYFTKFRIHNRLSIGEMMYLLLKGPVMIGIDAAHFSFAFYKSGVLKYDCGPNSVPNHSMLIVGFANDPIDPKKYWIVRNSWGERWGNQGYVHIAIDVNWNACGLYENIVEFLN